MLNDPCCAYFSDEILKGLIAKIGLPPYAVLSIIAAAESNERGPVRMSIEKIAELMGKSVETTRAALDTLKEQGLISIELQGRSNVYRVMPSSG
jgi:DNA-binding transcriptional ArsR family regulator